MNIALITALGNNQTIEFSVSVKLEISSFDKKILNYNILKFGSKDLSYLF